jgi:hypothetical protein
MERSGAPWCGWWSYLVNGYGQQVWVLVSYVDGQGFTERVEAAPIPVGLEDDGDAVFSISGTPAVGTTLTAMIDSADPDRDPSAGYSYQWESSADGLSWTPIATDAETDALTTAEEGRQVRVVVSYMDGQGFTESFEAAPVSVGLEDDGGRYLLDLLRPHTGGRGYPLRHPGETRSRWEPTGRLHLPVAELQQPLE